MFSIQTQPSSRTFCWLIEMKYLYASWSSMADDKYCILKFSHWHQLTLHYHSIYHARRQNPWYKFLYQSVTKGKTHYKCESSCSILVSKDRRCIFLPVISTGRVFRLSQGRRCMLADRRNTMFIYSRSYEGVQMKWKVEIQIHWIECISIDTLTCRNKWNMRYVCPLVKHQ